MKKLTEEMVIARAKISDMSKIKRLNCWGSELADVSLLRKMPNVEVLSLSINKIGNLSDFEFCRQLQELYVRQNEIQDLNQVCYLQNLSNLKHLWLGENPCADTDGYRLAVIRALPQLQKLDNIVIQPDELSEAMKKGRVLYHPQEQQELEEEYEPPQPNNYRNQGDYPEQYYQSPDRSPPRQEPEYEPEEPVEYYEEEERREYESPPRQRRQSDQRRSYTPDPDATPVYYDDRRNANNYDQESPRHQQPYYDRSPTKEYIEEPRITPDSPRETKIIPNSQSNNSIKSNKSWLPSSVSFKEYIEDPDISEKAKMLLNAQIIPRNSHSTKSMRVRKSKCCANKISMTRSEKSRRMSHTPKKLITELRIDVPKEEVFVPPVEICCEKQEYTNGDRHYHQSQYRQHEGSDGSNHSHPGVYERRDQSCDKNSCPSNHRPPFNRRRVTRNSNILSAVLCLVKELDYPSLEVVEMAVRCRMDELEE